MKNEIKELQKQLSEEIDSKKRIKILLDISSKYRYLSDDKNAFKSTDAAMVEAERIDFKKGIAKIFKEISLIHYSKLSLDKALDYSFQAVSILKTLGEDKDVSDILCNIGVFYNALNVTEKAKDYYCQSIEYNSQNIVSINNLGEYYAVQGNRDKAIEYYKLAVKLSEKQNRNIDLAYALKSLGEVYSPTNSIEAIKYLNQAMQILKSNKDEYAEAFTLLALSKTYLNMNESEKALTFALRVKEIAEYLNNNEIFWFCYELLSDIYEAMKEFEKANESLRYSLKLHEQMYSGKITHRIAELEAAYELEKQDLETKQLLEKSARLASIGVMTAGITHEINQPLNSIVINSDGILFKDDRDKVLPQSYRQSIDKIFKSAQRIDQIIKHMRTYWNSGDELIRNNSLSINNSIKDALGLLNQQIKSHGIELQIDLTSKNPMIMGNKVHIEQITINLITNSIQALDRTENLAKKISITTKVMQKKVTLRIEDNGVGFSMIDKKDIFDPFYSTKKTDKGMGLGLAIVKNYLTQMNGEIEFQNKEDGGVIFSLSFPIIVGE